MQSGLCIFGEVLFDIFPDGNRVLGGAPFNVAWHLHAFGEAPLLISRVGDDPAGDRIKQAMIDWGMNMDALQTDDGLPTGQVRVELIAGEPVYDIVSPSAYDAIALTESPIAHCGLLYHGSLALRHADSARALQQIIDARPDTVFIDVNLRPPWWKKHELLALLNQADWVKLNNHEFDELFADNGAGDRLRRFIDCYGLSGVILTHGKDGAEVLLDTGEHCRVRPEARVKKVDTVGAGDAFTSVMILGIARQWPIQTTIRRAQEFSSEIVGCRGATVNDRRFYQRFLSSWNQ